MNFFTGIERLSPPRTISVKSDPGKMMDEVDRIANAIALGETGGRRDPYKVRSDKPTVRAGGRLDWAYGKYQIMGDNIASWSKEALGRTLTLEGFKNNPQAQEQIARYRFKKEFDKYKNPDDVASVWFSGRPAKGNYAKDSLGTSVPAYLAKFRKNYGTSYPTPQIDAPKVKESGRFSIDPARDLAKMEEEYKKKNPNPQSVAGTLTDGNFFSMPVRSNSMAYSEATEGKYDTLSFFKDVARAPIRSVLSTALSTRLGNRLGSDREIRPEEDFGKLGSMLLGQETIKPIREMGQDTLTGFGASEDTALKYGGIAGVGFVLADLFPSVKGARTAFKVIAKLDDPIRISKELKTLGMADEAITKLAPRLVKITDPAKVEQIVGRVQDAVKKNPGLADPLISEARKYKSAEEFVKSQNRVFHGGTEFNPSLVDEQGISVAKNYKDSVPFAGGTKELKAGRSVMNELYIDRGAKILPLHKIPKNLYRYDKTLELNTPIDGTFSDIVKHAKENGYDAIDLRNFGESEIRVLDPDVLKTKSQLTDLWKKANAPATRSPQVPGVQGETSTRLGQRTLPGKTIQKPKLSEGSESIASSRIVDKVSLKKPYNINEEKAIAKTAKDTGDPPGVVRRVKNKVGETFTKVVEYVQNSDIRVRKLVEQKGAKVSDASDPYLKATLYPGRVASKVEAGRIEAKNIIQDLKKVADEFKTDSKALKKELNDYLVAKHAPERNAALGDGAAGITTADATARIKEIEASPQGKRIKEIADKAAELNKKTLDLLHESGVISDELYNTLRTKYKNHVPLQRVFEETEDIGGALSGRGFDVKSSGIKAAKGSQREVDDILTNIVNNYEQAVLRSEKNIVDQATLAFARENKDIVGDILEVTKPKAIGQSFDGKVLMERTTDPTILQMFENGKPVWIKIKDVNLAIALRGVGREKLGGLLNVVGKFTRLYSGLATRFNPEFAFPNKIRDLQETAIYLASQKGVGFKGALGATVRDPISIKDVIAGLREADTPGARLYHEMKSLGGTTGGFGLSTKTETALNLAKIERIANSTTRKIADNLIEYIDDWNTIFEDSTRLSVYKQALKQGLSKERAAFLAKEASINFNRMGKGGPVINALWMFSNASLQGSAKMMRSLRNPKVLGATVLTVGGSVAAVNQWNDSVDPQWRDKVSKWDRLNGLTVVIPTTDGGSRYITIPVSWGLKPIKVMADYAYDAVSNQEFSVKDMMSDVAVAMLEAYNPVGGTDLVSSLIPSILDIPFEIERNKSWSGSKIRPDYNKNLPDDLEYFQSQKETKVGRAAISIAELLKNKANISFSPANIKYAYEGYVSGAGRAVSRVVNLINGIATNKPIPLDEYPFVSRFYKQKTAEEIGKVSSDPKIEKLQDRLETQERGRATLREEAEVLYKEVKGKPAEEVAQKIKEAATNNPQIVDKLKDVMEAEARNLTYEDKLLQDLGVKNGERAKFIAEELGAMKTKEEKSAYLKELAEKKLITTDILKQVLLFQKR